MASQLKNILHFVAIPIGGMVSLPHNLNAQGHRLVPDFIDPTVTGLTITADDINVTVTNTSGAPVTLDVLVEAWHTFERAFGAAGVPSLVPQPFVSGGGAASGISTPAIVFVFRPGGVAGANVYTTWPSLMAALGTVQGAKVIEFDDSIVSPCVVPAGGPYDMTDVTWSGGVLAPDPTEVQVNEGVTFTKLRRFNNGIRVTFAGTTPPVTDFDVTGQAPDPVVLELGSKITTSGAGPFFRNSTVGGNGALIVLLTGAELDTGTNPIFDLGVAGAFGAVALTGPFTVLQGNTISGAVGTVLLLAVTASGLSQFDESQPAFAGAVLNFNLTKWRAYPTDTITGNTAIGETNLVVRVDPTAGPVNITFPPAFNARGQSLIVKNVSASANAINILPSGGDTIDGGVSASITAARGVLHFISDGTSDWMIV